MMEPRVDWEKEKEGIIEAYEAGMSLRGLANVLGVSHVTLCAKLDEWGVPRRQGDSRRGLLVKSLVGRRFGSLKIIYRDGIKYPTKWVARCDKCGSKKSYTLGGLRGRRTCGCGPRGPRRGHRHGV